MGGKRPTIAIYMKSIDIFTALVNSKTAYLQELMMLQGKITLYSHCSKLHTYICLCVCTSLPLFAKYMKNSDTKCH